MAGGVPLLERASSERERLFVGREVELGAVRRWLDDGDAPARLIALYGMGGLGKTALMRRMADLSRERGVTTAWLDGRTCPRTPSKFRGAVLAYWRRRAGSLGGPVGSSAGARGPDPRGLLCIDNAEALSGIEGWLREEFFPQLLDAGVLVVTAARRGPSLTWRGDAAWRERLLPLPLSPLTRGECLTLLHRLGLDGHPAVPGILRQARGLPLALVLAVDGLARPVQPTGRGAEAETAPWRELGAHLLRETAADELQIWLDTLAVVPEANLERLAEVSLCSPTAAQYRRLAQLSFTEGTDRGLALHDIAREHLLADLRRRQPGRLRELRRRAVAVWQRQLRLADAEDRRRISSQLLSICRDAMPSVPSGDLTNTPDAVQVDAIAAGDLAHLHGFLAAWGRPSALPGTLAGSHALLDEVAARFPEAIHVARSPLGQPLGFVVSAPLFEQTVELIDAHLDRILERMLPDQHVSWRKGRREDVDTFFFALLGIEPEVEETGYSRPEILGCLMREMLIPLGEGTRLVASAFHPSSKELFRRLGARRSASPLDGALEVYQIDMRGQDFAVWVSRFLDLSEGDADPPAIPPADLQAALACLHDPAGLDRTPLAARLGCSGTELAQRLQRALTATPPPAPLDQDEQSLLQATYIRALAPREAQEELHLSRATYFRHRRAALVDLARALRAPEPA